VLEPRRLRAARDAHHDGLAAAVLEERLHRAPERVIVVGCSEAARDSALLASETGWSSGPRCALPTNAVIELGRAAIARSSRESSAGKMLGMLGVMGMDVPRRRLR